MEGAGRGWQPGQGQAFLIPSDTIVALSSGAAPAAIAIVRISGPAALAAAAALTGRLPAPRRAALRALRDAGGELLDRALVLVFPGPASATGEDLVELHCHGGRAVVAAVEQAVLAHPAVRRAAPGEFTRRALTNGRIDLAEAEGLADLLEAETETQRRAALIAAEGQVGRAVRGWLDRLAMLGAEIEASIDYAEEGDIEREAASLGEVDAARRALAADMTAVLAAPPVERWRDGIRVVVAGPPNAGKSTLVNLLAAREASIVSPTAGTTRDRIEVPVRRDGLAYLLTDTAGLHDASDDPVEVTGMDRARESIDAADLVLWLGDDDPPVDGCLRVHARADLPGREVSPCGTIAVRRDDPGSIEQLWGVIAGRTVLPLPSMPLHARERSAVFDAWTALMRGSAGSDLLAEDIRVAATQLATVIGANATELMLDSLFRRFCVGK